MAARFVLYPREAQLASGHVLWPITCCPADKPAFQGQPMAPGATDVEACAGATLGLRGFDAGKSRDFGDKGD
jgi:hypothetical protein